MVYKHNSIILDTSFFIALSKTNDIHHQNAKRLARTYSKKEWMTTWPVLTELSHLLPSHKFLDLLEEQQEGLFSLFSFVDDPVTHIIELKRKYNDHDIDLADISLIILAEYLGHGAILTFDRNDFSYLTWDKNRHFEIHD